LLQNEPQLAGEATEKLAFKIQSKNKTESLFALDTLEECMSMSEDFRSKVGKFHFLNELIKLVSKNYLGDQTDATVQARILDMLFLWTKKFPKETKIKDAYDVLKTQGVIHEPVKNIKTNLHAVSKTSPATVAANRVANDECSEKLKRLCNSKNPKDIEEANLLIQTMVREDTRRNEMKTKRLLELNKIKDLIELLDAMLDNYCPGETPQDELETIQDQYLACKKTPATIHRLAAETQYSEGMLGGYYI
jgi:ADP-ribosylation factor-binding protein GGA